jgi:hypothetical protein
VPFETIPGDFFSVLSIARGYETLGETDKMMEAIKVAEPLLLDRFSEAKSERDIKRLQQFIQMIQIAHFKTGDFESAADFSQKLAVVAGDSTLAQTAEELRQVYGQFNQPKLPAQPQPAPANNQNRGSSTGEDADED